MENTIKIISKTIQEFEGVRYYLCGKYYQHNGIRLHRHVWERKFGKVPTGFHVHHIDGNRSNNDFVNLQLLPMWFHLLIHGRTEIARKRNKENIKFAQENAKKWHKSTDGKIWHKQQAKKQWRNLKPKTGICKICGTPFIYRSINKRIYCSNKCKERNRYLHGSRAAKRNG